MANIKSAKKRILVNSTKAARNKAIRSAVKTSIKKVETAVENKDKAAALPDSPGIYQYLNSEGRNLHNQQSYIQGRLSQK